MAVIIIIIIIIIIIVVVIIIIVVVFNILLLFLRVVVDVIFWAELLFLNYLNWKLAFGSGLMGRGFWGILGILFRVLDWMRC